MKRFIFKRQNIHTIEIFVDPNSCGDDFLFLCDDDASVVKSCLHLRSVASPMEKSVIPRSGSKRTPCIMPSCQSPFTWDWIRKSPILKTDRGEFFLPVSLVVLLPGSMLENVGNNDLSVMCILYNLRCYPNRTYIVSGSNVCQEQRPWKDRVTAVLCCSLTGTCKVPPLIIGTSINNHTVTEMIVVHCHILIMYKERYKHWWCNTCFSRVFAFLRQKKRLAYGFLYKTRQNHHRPRSSW